MSNPLDDELNQDFVRVIQASPLLKEAFDGLPEAEREAVMSQWNSLVWQTILEGVGTADKQFPPKNYLLTLGFAMDPGSVYGKVEISKEFDKLHEYAIVPVYNSYTGEIVQWAISHRSKVFSDKLLAKVTDAEAKHAPEPTNPDEV